MANTADDATRILAYLVEHHSADVDGHTLAAHLRLSAQAVNDAVTILVENSLAEWQQWFGTYPFAFGTVSSTSRGKYEFERSRDITAVPAASVGTSRALPAEAVHMTRPPAPVGSPYGFQEEDWELVSERKSARGELHVVLGHQSASQHFKTEDLRRNVDRAFRAAVDQYNRSSGSERVQLVFTALGAGYGEHLFNEIARDIISADIAVFDTSDLNSKCDARDGRRADVGRARSSNQEGRLSQAAL